MPLVKAALSSNGIHVDSRGGVTIPVKLGSDYRLCRIEGSGTEFKMAYLKDRWHYFNKHLFGGVMKEPNFTISKSVKALGRWWAGKRVLEMGKRMFLLRDDRETLGTLVHEMCHQYVSEHIRPITLEEMGPTGHGPAWQNTMIAVGMPPDDKFVGDVDIITQKKVLDTRDKQRELLKTLKEREVAPQVEQPEGEAVVPKTGQSKWYVARYINPEANVDCPAIILQHDQDGDRAVHVGMLIDKNGDIHKAVYLRKDRTVVPGPLKIKTSLYKRASELLIQIQTDGMPLVVLPPPKKY